MGKRGKRRFYVDKDGFVGGYTLWIMDRRNEDPEDEFSGVVAEVISGGMKRARIMAAALNKAYEEKAK